MEITKEEYERILTAVEKAELRAKRAKAVNECNNIASKFWWYHQNFRDDLVISEGLWARKSPDIHAEYGFSGKYNGYDNVKKFNEGRPCPKGKMLFHPLNTPVIEVAGDGKTAKGVWLIHGYEGGSVPEKGSKGVFLKAPAYKGTKVWCYFTWAKLAIDFIEEDGEWKMWHFHIYDYARATFDEDWVRFMQKDSIDTTQSDKKGHPIKFSDDKGNIVYMEEADEPPTYRWVYNGFDSKEELVPRPPVPYETFDKSTEY